ncbi:2'-5' RNA ligase family protein [Sphingosinicella terrae]|uniref:2'-5' RNA ligase family protein n=1 Tax=Sphingosinicella terrae TaxID=2172047 RepID=UPI0032D9768E
MFGPGDDGWIQQMRREHYPADLNRVPAHLTLFRQLPPSAEGELSARLAQVAAAPPPRAAIAGIVDLGGGTALRVVSDALEAIHAELAETLHGLLTPQDQAPWRPHVTVQNKVEPRLARQLQQQLRATFEPRPLAVRALATWRYRDGPWDKVRDYPFRG